MSVALFAARSTARSDDFLIVEHPARLVIFDRYQQQVKGGEGDRLLPFTPFRILAEHDVLGDGFTPCMKVETHGTLYYLQKDENGELTRVREAGWVRTIRNATLLRDSVEIVSAGGLPLADVRQQRTLNVPRGTVLARIFTLSVLTYVYVVPFQRYGWMRLDVSGEKKQWRVLARRAPHPSEDLARVFPAVVQRVEEVNEKLHHLFDHLSSTTSRRVPAPQWRVHRSSESITCTLETSLSVEQFGESSTLLARRIESAVLGTSLRVRAQPGSIVVR